MSINSLFEVWYSKSVRVINSECLKLDIKGNLERWYFKKRTGTGGIYFPYNQEYLHDKRSNDQWSIWLAGVLINRVLVAISLSPSKVLRGVWSETISVPTPSFADMGSEYEWFFDITLCFLCKYSSWGRSFFELNWKLLL